MRTPVAAIMAVGVGVGTAAGAAAAPAQDGRDTTPVNYRAAIDKDGSAVITTDGGSLVNDNGVFKIKAANGQVVAGIPLQVRVDEFLFPVEAKIENRQATLTPKPDRLHASYQPTALPFEESATWKTPYEREKDAWNRMFQIIIPSGVIGTALGAVGGGAAGCVGGALVPSVLSGGLLVALFGVGPIAGCLAGIGVFAPIGAVAGALLITLPASIAAVVQYFTTVNAPFVPPKN